MYPQAAIASSLQPTRPAGALPHGVPKGPKDASTGGVGEGPDLLDSLDDRHAAARWVAWVGAVWCGKGECLNICGQMKAPVAAKCPDPKATGQPPLALAMYT